MRNISKPAELEVEVRQVRAFILELGSRRSLRDPMALVLEEFQLTEAQSHSIFWLGQQPMTMGDLARHIGITEKTVTGVVDRLEREEYVRRERDAADRRVVRVHLTRKGQGVYRRTDQALNEHISYVLGLLDTSDRTDLFRIFEKLVSRLTPPAGEGGKDTP